MAENHDPVISDGAEPEAAEVTAGASAEGCPGVHGRVQPTQGDANSQWWPNRLNLKILNKNAPQVDPNGAGFDYAAEFSRNRFAARTVQIKDRDAHTLGGERPRRRLAQSGRAAGDDRRDVFAKLHAQSPVA